MTNQVTVEIKGKQGAGKTTLFHLIVLMLKNSGYIGEISPETEFVSEGAHLVKFAKDRTYDIIIVTRPSGDINRLQKPERFKSSPEKERKPMSYKHWTQKELNYLRENYHCLPNRELADALGRTKESVTVKAGELELYKGPEFHRYMKKTREEATNG